MASDPAGRLKLVKHYAEFEDFGGSQPRGIRRKPLLKRDAELDEVVSEDEWEDQFFKLVLDKINNAVGFSHGTSCREVPPGGPVRLPYSKGKQVSSSRPPKRSKSTS
ncbi:uncharacterized protein LOC8086200 [Sorghum bicolor]|nr:uncharacterized protein LOC8086200 [Sorghum bicolor]|eukprot:XP_021318121.1 uncharacterized protein LOC8086200 [Sorghum bicolor]